MRRLALALATAGGAGYAPIGPGTAGSLVGLLVYVLVQRWTPLAQVGVTAVIVILGIWAGSVASAHFGREDPGQVVIDEVAGQMLTLLAIGVSGRGLVLGFVLFRVFDILKPWPVRRFERLPRGYGIMADDLMAGVYAHLLLQAAGILRPGVF